MRTLEVRFNAPIEEWVRAIVEQLCDFPDTYAVVVPGDKHSSLYAMCVGQCAMQYAKCVIENDFPRDVEFSIIRKK